MRRDLGVWMNGERVGIWSSSRTGVPIFHYEKAWIESERGRPLSLSLPFVPGNQPHRGEVVASWFDNLLPDSNTIRDRIKSRFNTESTQAHDLLAAIGRDCVGAVQILSADADPGEVRKIEADRVSESEVAKLLRGVTVPRLSADNEHSAAFRISIAGAQEKTALLRRGDEWYLPRGATPTTHILKLPLGLIGNMRADLRESIENEWLSMQFLREIGLPVAQVSIARFSDEVSEEKVLVVERFDREWVSGEREWILRLPQEDLCQATGTPANKKYESDGGPGIARGLALAGAGQRPVEDALTFAKTQLAFWLLAAPDGHAKNFSIFLRRDGHIFTPLYDILSAWPIVGPGPNQWAHQKVELAMGLRGKSLHRKIDRIALRHWRALAEQCGAPTAFSEMQQMVLESERAIERLSSALPSGFPEHVWDTISRGVQRQRERFLDGTASRGESG